MSEPRISLFSLFVYKTCRAAIIFWLKVWERFEVFGQENVPATGGCLLACNHVSYLDPPILGCGAMHRYVHFMARDTLFKSALSRWWLTTIQCVPIDRTRGDISALKKGIQLLKSGQVLGLFPEGTRSINGELQPPKSGIGFLIAKAGVPVVPTYVDGSFRAFPKGAKWVKPGKIRIYYGKPIQPEEIARFGDEREAYEQIAKLVMTRISELRSKR